jgi:hypothetical protein
MANNHISLHSENSMLIILGMKFASQDLQRHSILSPTAKPFIDTKPVSAFLQEQEKAPSSSQVPYALECRQKDFDMLETLTSVTSYRIDDETERGPRTPSPLLLPSFQSPPQFGSIDCSTPVESVQCPTLACDPSPEPVVRVTKTVWHSMGNTLDLLTKQKRQLESQVATLKSKQQILLDESHGVGLQLGKLRYQNEANRDQKAAMGRSLAQKDVEIRQQQLDMDNMNKRIAELEAEVKQCGKMIGEAEWLRSMITDTEAAHARDLEVQATAVRTLQETIERITSERDAALRAQVHVGDHVIRAQNLADTLSKREKLITDLRQKNLEEQMRVSDLEDEVERLQEKVNQESLDDFKEKLRDKSSQCDRFRTKLKETEHQLRLTQSRLMTAAKGGEFLRGGAHIVAPHEKSKLPKSVMPCSECYANNLTCDSTAHCRNCTERNTKCARWRCSLKQKLGECQMAPCALPHDVQGWLIMTDARPQW